MSDSINRLNLKHNRNRIRNGHGGSRLLEVVEKDVLKRFIQSFNDATGLRANIVDTEGWPIFGLVEAQKSCKFCQLIWQYQSGFERCRGAYIRASKQAARYKEPYIFRCPAGLIEWATPIVINGEHFGSIICGQVLMWEPEEFFWMELREMNKNLGVDLEPLIEAARELEVVTGAKVQAAADLLFVATNYIIKIGWENLRHQQELLYQRFLLAGEIHNRKQLEKMIDSQRLDLNYTLERERELVSNIKLGDEEMAKKTLRELLADIAAIGVDKLSVIKARVLELIVVISRAVVDCGADFASTLNINERFVKVISDSHEVTKINIGAVQALEEYIRELPKNNKVKNHQVINMIKRYIRGNYHRSLTLEEIARSVNFSPNYVCRLFKEEQSITLMDYITKVKIEEAKKLLRDSQFNIDEIAERLGFNDPSYFSKVFRRTEGMSPSQFRHQA